MFIDIFSELQCDQPWKPGIDATIIRNGIEQAKLADELGYGTWWQVEHHGATSFSLSASPEVFFGALAMSTTRLRLGQAGVLTPYKINHPVKVAERAAFLDILSGGRFELGMARSSANEWEVFEVPAEVTQLQFNEMATMIPKMWADEPFSWDSDLIQIPETQVVPKPLQKHPRLWACGQSPEGAFNAGRLGMGFLGVTILQPLSTTVDLKVKFEEGVAVRSADVMQPNMGYSLFTFAHCAPTRQAAIESRAAEAALWYVNNAGDFFKVPREALMAAVRATPHPEGVSWRQATADDYAPEACDPNDPHPAVRLLNRQYLGLPIDPEEAYEVIGGIDSVLIGDPETVLRKVKRIQAIGVDRLLMLQQFGQIPHEQVCRSMRLIGNEIIPAVA